MIRRIDRENVPNRDRRKYNTVTKDIVDFHNSDWEACEVDTTHYKTAASCVSTYACAIKRNHVAVSAIIRDNRVYLVRNQ